jgi:type I restriction enzyme S subunit
MFGDPVTNSLGVKTTELENVVKLQRGFDLPVNMRDKDGYVPIYASNGVIDYHNEAKVISGGVITGRSGTIGKVYFTHGDYWPLNTTLFSVDLHGNNIVYLAHLLEFFDLTRFSSGSGVPTLNRNTVHRELVPIAPLDLQTRFAAFAEAADKLKFYVQQTIDKINF